jgi:N-acetylglucosamine-6-phosphate deacetylase
VSAELRLHADRVAMPDGELAGATVVVREGRIAAIHPAPAPPDDSEDSGVRPDSSGADGEAAGRAERVQGWLVPGFVDSHCHGGGGADFATTDPDEVRRAAAFHRAHGSTTQIASLVTATPEVLTAQLDTLAPLVEAGELAGVHLEGPFLSPAHRGAHDPALLAAPTPDSVDRLLDAGRGCVRMVTLAPELAGGLAAIEHLAAAGVVPAFGHSDGDERLVRDAISAGATVATHLFNAMRPIHHREPGPVPRLLTDPRVMVELICDGFHLHPDVIMMAAATAGADRVALVTDAMLAAGAPDGRYRLGSLAVAVAGGQARLIEPDGSLGSIAGSTLTMSAAFERVVGLGVPVSAAARMAATTPAGHHSLTDVGAIEVGRRADFCVVDEDGSLQRVMRAGCWI